MEDVIAEKGQKRKDSLENGRESKQEREREMERERDREEKIIANLHKKWSWKRSGDSSSNL